MAEDDLAAHLGSHHRNTLHRIFEHPTSHNIDRRAVVSLLEAIGSVERHHDIKVEVYVGSSIRFFDVPEHKDMDINAVVDLRRPLAVAGYEG
jgi:hypothetical protein